jgi:hypothetical protein
MKNTVLVATLLLAGCGSIVREVHEVDIIRYETVPLPEALLQPNKVDVGTLETNGDIERAFADALLTLGQCNADKEAIKRLTSE